MIFLSLNEIKKRNDRARIRVYGYHIWLKLQHCFLSGVDYGNSKRGNYLTE